jgi:hypothetical protein
LVELAIEADLAQEAGRALLGGRQLAMHLAAGDAAHREQTGRVAEVHFIANLRGEGVHQQIADERVVDRVAVVAAAEADRRN